MSLTANSGVLSGSSVPKILVLDRDNIGPDLDWSSLAAVGELLVRDTTGDAELTAVLQRERPSIVVSNRPRIGKESLALPFLRLVCLTATGTNTVDIDAARRCGVTVCNIKGYSTESVAQHTFALVLELTNRVARMDVSTRMWRTDQIRGASSNWTDLSHRFHEISGKTWGIIGMGAIGRRVASVASAFGCAVIWSSMSGSGRQEAWPRRELSQLLSESDIVSIHSPITENSRNSISYSELCLMKSNAFLVNVGRGGIVNEADLARTLHEKRIAGAALDVLSPEPPVPDNPLFDFEPENSRLILTPHMAWAAVEARQRCIEETAANISAWLNGVPRNLV